jgi:hypothetical protein
MAFTLTRLKLFTKELGRVCGGRLAVSAVLATGVSLTESAGILLLAPLLNLAGAGSMMPALSVSDTPVASTAETASLPPQTRPSSFVKSFKRVSVKAI